MFQTFHRIVAALLYALPDISNFVLVTVGIVMSLPKLAERIEINPKTRFSLAAACLLIGLLGFVGSVRERRQADFEMTRLVRNVDSLVTSTNTLVKNTNSVLTTVGVLTPQVTILNAQVAEIDARLNEAKARNDFRTVAELQAKADAAQKLADEAAETLSASLLPQVVEQLKAKEAEQSLAPTDSASAQQTLTVPNLAALGPLLVSANVVRKQILSGGPQTDEDRREAAVFEDAARGGFSSYNGPREIAYLQRLLDRVIPPAPRDIRVAIQ